MFKYISGLFCSIIPTQQQLQDIYEENLRQRESSRFSSESAARAQVRVVSYKNWSKI